MAAKNKMLMAIADVLRAEKGLYTLPPVANGPDPGHHGNITAHVSRLHAS